VRSIAQAISVATGIIFGLAVALVFPFSVYARFWVRVALCLLPWTVDAYGSISDNAGGIPVLSELCMGERKATGALDAVGNTTATIARALQLGQQLWCASPSSERTPNP
jgi:Na+/H+-translocating membrane pyrophosphatase